MSPCAHTLDAGRGAESDGFLPRLRALAETFARELPVRRVAVVGNQPLDPSPERAHTIDTADLVFRVNGFRADDPGEPTVGHRTDVVVFNRGVRPTPWLFEAYTQRLYLLIEPGRMHWEPEQYPHFWPRDLGFITVSNRDVILPLNAAMGLDALRDGLWATTGMTMIWIARTLFPEAVCDVTGMSFVDEPDQRSWSHAYDTDCPVGPEHRLALEAALVRTWIDEKSVRFHR
ncbi:hypothetical protein ACFQZV_12460 [Microbacterium koreense]|uniref:Glycosyltransferase family 29 (Sialyltransferase) n=1 Tax=Microbacterium koreense TaxID=323761 RepID=A0ABW2ZTX0_9MICO